MYGTTLREALDLSVSEQPIEHTAARWHAR
jgi:hypothetical protein